MKKRPNDLNQIWFLTSVWYELMAYNKKYDEYLTKHDCRTFGYYHGWDAAFTAVDNNQGNMQENNYPYLVMECIGEGVHALVSDEQWFRWGGSKWVPCRRPQALKELTNWALG